MPYFQVDDQFHSHPKTAWLSAGAVALWVRSGSHCAAYLTDGFIDEDTVKRLGGRGASIQELLTIRAPHTSPLWFKVDGGYQFHDWDQYQPTSVEVKENRRKARERMKAVRANKGRTFEGSSPDVRVAQSNPIHAIPDNKDLTGHPHVSSTPAEDDMSHLDPVIAAVVAATAEGGLRISPLGAPALIAFIESRRGPRSHPIKVPVRYYPKAVAESWAEVSKFIHEEGLAS